MAKKQAPVAGSVQGPAVADPAQIAESQNNEQNQNQELVEVDSQPFPREVKVVNDSPMGHIVAGVYVPAYESAPVTVRDQDQITRIQTDCQHLMELTPAYAELEVQPLRVVDDAAE